jgi:hypothetical protein
MPWPACCCCASLTVVCYGWVLDAWFDSRDGIYSLLPVATPPYQRAALACAVFFGLVPAGFGFLVSRGVGWARIAVTVFAVPGVPACLLPLRWPTPLLFDALAVCASAGLLVAVVLLWVPVAAPAVTAPR